MESGPRMVFLFADPIGLFENEQCVEARARRYFGSSIKRCVAAFSTAVFENGKGKV
jgi:hypothetical protein